MGFQREIVDSLPAGNIPALLGLDIRSGETISNQKDVAPFECIHYVSEPVVTQAVEAKHPRDLPKLVEAMRGSTSRTPTSSSPSTRRAGETLMAGMGVLHLEIATTMLQQAGARDNHLAAHHQLPGDHQAAGGPDHVKSPNRHNKIFIKVEPLAPDIVELIRKGTSATPPTRRGHQDSSATTAGTRTQARTVVEIDPKGNMLTEETKGVQFLQESMDSMRAGFEDIMKNGPLAYELCRGVKVTLTHYVPHEDAAHRTYAQLMPATRRAILGAMLLGEPDPPRARPGHRGQGARPTT